VKPTSFASFYGLSTNESCKFNQDFPNFTLFILTINFLLVYFNSLAAYYQAIVIEEQSSISFAVYRGQSPRRPSDVQQWPSGQTEPLKAAKGRAKSELRNVAPTSVARRRPQNSSELRQQGL